MKMTHKAFFVIACCLILFTGCFKETKSQKSIREIQPLNRQISSLSHNQEELQAKLLTKLQEIESIQNEMSQNQQKITKLTKKVNLCIKAEQEVLVESLQDNPYSKKMLVVVALLLIVAFYIIFLVHKQQNKKEDSTIEDILIEEEDQEEVNPPKQETVEVKSEENVEIIETTKETDSADEGNKKPEK